MSNFGDHPAGFFGVSGFYNGAATTSYRNIPGQTLTRDYGASPTSTKIMSFGGWIKRQKAGFYSNLLSGTLGGGGVAQGYIYVNERKRNNKSQTLKAKSDRFPQNRA